MSAPVARPAARPLRVWSPLPFVASAIAFGLVAHLLNTGDHRDRAPAFALMGSGLICFSIGCVCRTSWGISLAHHQEVEPAALEPRQ